MKIGVFGGSFNPPHKMHKDIALKLLEQQVVDKIIFVPTQNQYTGDKEEDKKMISINHRYQMLNLMFNGNHQVEISKVEDKKEKVYTYQTLNILKRENPDADIFFIMGTDQIRKFHLWKKPENILRNHGIIGIEREGEEGTLDESLKKYESKVTMYDFNIERLSSTIIRELLQNDPDSPILPEVLDSAVLNYINENNLYSIRGKQWII